MSKVGANSYGYLATVTVRGTVGSQQGVSRGDFLHALQGGLEQAGFTLDRFKIAGKMPNLQLAIVVTPSKNSFTTQSVKAIIDRIIAQQAGTYPSWSMDPCGVCTCIVPCNAGFFASIGNFFHNAVYGTLSTCQKNQLIASEAGGLTKASAGSICPASATKIACSDVTGSLLSNSADPAQSSILGSSGLACLEKNLSMYGVIALVILGVFVFVYAKGSR